MDQAKSPRRIQTMEKKILGGRQIINIDLDGTLCNEVCFTQDAILKATPKQDVIDKVNELYVRHYVVIYTARQDHLIPASLEWLRRNNVRYHAWSNLKIPTDIGYLDDKSLLISDIDKLQ